MIQTDSDALECDLAETYQIYDMRAWPLHRIALFASGLGEDSRIRRKLSGQSYPLSTLIQAGILDALNMNLWAQSGGTAQKPVSVFAHLTEERTKTPEGASVFTDPQAFEQALLKLKKEADPNG